MSNIKEEVKQWMRIDFEDDDSTIESLILASGAIIKKSTGVTAEAIESDKQASALYVTLQKMIITGIYENRDGTCQTNSMILQLSTLLSTYKS